MLSKSWPLSSESVMLEAESDVARDCEVASPLDAGAAGVGLTNPILFNRVLISPGKSSSSDDESFCGDSPSSEQLRNDGSSLSSESLLDNSEVSSFSMVRGISLEHGMATLMQRVGMAMAAELFFLLGLVRM
jgi:hypothetical protein